MKANKPIPKFNAETTLNAACQLPYCKIDREQFLTKQLTNRVTTEQLRTALIDGTINAKIPLCVLDELANHCIRLETAKATALSTAAGLPGGLATCGTIPADLAQYYAHIFRIAQKLAYLYGYKEIDLKDATEDVLIICLGAMFGVRAAVAALAKFSANNLLNLGINVLDFPLGYRVLDQFSKKLLRWICVKLTRDALGKGIGKAIPILGGVVCGGLTLATFAPMTYRLQACLSLYARMSPEKLAKEANKADIIMEAYLSTSTDKKSNNTDDVTPSHTI